MELTESIESINRQLRDLFGIDTVTGQPMFRIVFSDDQFENRRTDRTESGILLLTPIIARLPKYQWIKGYYILEQLVQVPEFQQEELGIKISYEPLWVFKGESESPVPPALWASKFVIDTVYAARGKSSLAKYVDEEAKNPEEMREKRIKQLEEELFGDESGLLGTTITGQAVVISDDKMKER
jgi:hypothetical protein